MKIFCRVSIVVTAHCQSYFFVIFSIPSFHCFSSKVEFHEYSNSVRINQRDLLFDRCSSVTTIMQRILRNSFYTSCYIIKVE